MDNSIKTKKLLKDVRKRGTLIPLLDEKGNIVKDEKGNIIYIPNPSLKALHDPRIL